MHFKTIETHPPRELHDLTDEILRTHLPTEQVSANA